MRQHAGDVTSNAEAQGNALAHALGTSSDWDDMPVAESLGANGPKSSKGDNLSSLSEDTGSDELVTDSVETPEGSVETPASEAKAEAPSEIEFVTRGGKSLKVPRPDDKQLARLMSKAHGADEGLRQLAADRKAFEQEKAQAAASSRLPENVTRAQSLANAGHFRESITELAKSLGENGSKLLEAYIDDEIEYRQADPSNRMLKDSERRTNSSKVNELYAQEQLNAERSRIAEEANAARAQAYTSHVQDAFDRFDLSQWIEDTTQASSLNNMMRKSAFAEVVKAQRAREANRQADLTSSEIRAIVGKEAKILVNAYGKTTKAATENKASTASTQTKQQIQADVKQSAAGNKPAAKASKPQNMQDLVSQLFGVSRI